MILCSLQAERNLMKNWWFLIDLSMSSRDHDTILWKIVRFHELYNSDDESTPCVSVHPSKECVIVYMTCTVYISTLRVDMDKPSWGPTNRETKWRNLPLIWPLTVFWIFKNSNYEKSWFWWPRQGDNEHSHFEASKRSGAMSRCGKMSETWSEVI